MRPGSLAPHGVTNVPPGSGPRHMKFHPNGRWIYVLNELALSVTVFDYDSQSGQMTAKQTLASVPAEQLVRKNSRVPQRFECTPMESFFTLPIVGTIPLPSTKFIKKPVN